MPTETVTVLLSSVEVVWQRVPDRGTHYSEGPTAECGEPVSWYDELQTTGDRPTTSETGVQQSTRYTYMYFGEVECKTNCQTELT